MVCATRDPVVAANVKRHLATNMAKEIQALRGLDRGGIWARWCRSIPILGTLDDRLKYLLARGYKSQIVEQISQWPGLDIWAQQRQDVLAGHHLVLGLRQHRHRRPAHQIREIINLLGLKLG